VFHCNWVEPNPQLKEAPTLICALQQHKPMLGRLLDARRKTSVFQAISRGPVDAIRSANLVSRRGGDVFEAAMDFQLGPGWYYLEESGGERFRWLSRNATFLVRLPPSTSRIAMLIEPAPTQGDVPLQFVAQTENQDGPVLTRQPVAGLTYLEFAVPAAPGAIAALHLTAEGAVERGGEDARPISYRVFACGSGTREISRPAGLKHWPSLSLKSRPSSKDWIALLEPHRRQLDEMGYPVHLHTNAASDFLLMSRARWLDVRGFPEIGMTRAHLDSLLCYAAHHCGVREEVLADPMRVYSIGPSSPTGPESYAMPPAVQHQDLMWLIAQMRSLHAPVIFNREDLER
jgi:hypothetical protein